MLFRLTFDLIISKVIDFLNFREFFIFEKFELEKKGKLYEKKSLFNCVSNNL